MGEVHVSRHLKELAWDLDKQLQTISNIKCYLSNYTTKELKNIAIFKFITILYALLCGPY